MLLDGSHKAHLKAPRGECVPKGNLLTLPEIASQLQIHKEVVRDLGVKGWLKLDKKKVEGYVRNVALPEVIQEFSNHYISIGTLARQLNVNSTNLADKLKLPITKVAIEINREIINKKNIKKIFLKNGDKIEVVHFIGGG